MPPIDIASKDVILIKYNHKCNIEIVIARYTTHFKGVVLLRRDISIKVDFFKKKNVQSVILASMYVTINGYTYIIVKTHTLLIMLKPRAKGDKVFPFKVKTIIAKIKDWKFDIFHK